MPDEPSEKDWSLPALVAILASRLPESYAALRDAAKDAAIGLHFDSAAWEAVNRTLRQMASESSVDAILARQQAAMAGISNSLGSRGQGLVRDVPTATDMQEAEADLRNRLPEITSDFLDIQATAKKITADPEKRNAIDRIAAVINENLAQLSPIAFLIVLWWILAMLPNPELSILAVWYLIAADRYRKKD
jgi:hypothetical protein